MRKEMKAQIIEDLTARIKENPNFYVTDIEGLNAEATAKLRRSCFFDGVLKGSSAIMFTTTPNGPAKLIKSFSAAEGKGKPELKAAYVQECPYIGAENLDALCNIKSREELIADIVALLQSPVKNVISALQSQGGGKLAGIVKTLSEK